MYLGFIIMKFILSLKIIYKYGLKYLRICEINIFNILINFKIKIIVNIITKNKIINDYKDKTFFISIFSILFSYNIKKYIDSKCNI